MLPQVKVQLPKDMGERTWGTELLVIDTPRYIGKLMSMRAGCAGGLQKHVEKDEASYLFSGEAWVYTDTGDGTLSRFKWLAGSAIHIPPGSVHKVEAITDCVIFEASTPHFNDRIRLEDQYGRTDTGGLPTTRTDGIVPDTTWTVPYGFYDRPGGNVTIRPDATGIHNEAVFRASDAGSR